MSGQHYMPLYVGDYLGDTSHLSTIEHGAYMLLLMHYWTHGGLPDNDDRLARIVRMTDQEWRSAKVVISVFFGRKWTHKRVDAELRRSAKRSENARNAAYKKHNKTKGLHANAVHARAYQTRPESISKEIESEAAPRRAREKRSRSPPDFSTFLLNKALAIHQRENGHGHQHATDENCRRLETGDGNRETAEPDPACPAADAPT